VLHEHPVWRERFARLLRSVLTETAGYRLFTETGLPIGSGVFSDAGRRLVERFLPRRHDHDLSELLSFLFWTRRDVRWLESLPTAVVVDVVDLLHDDDRSDDDLPARWAWSRGWCAIR
jgi:site-specific recombinase